MSDNFITIDVVPMGAVRMTKSDTWKTNPNHENPRQRQRDAVRRYFNFKNKVTSECKKHKYELGETLDIVFFLPMPASWSAKKRKAMQFEPHKVRPDIDNMLKGFMDAMKEQDADVYKVSAEKVWDYKGAIQINLD